MEARKEIIKKFNLYLCTKRMIIFFGTLTAFLMFFYMILRKFNYNIFSIVTLVLCIITSLIFILLLSAVVPMRKYILNMIKEYKNSSPRG